MKTLSKIGLAICCLLIFGCVSTAVPNESEESFISKAGAGVLILNKIEDFPEAEKKEKIEYIELTVKEFIELKENSKLTMEKKDDNKLVLYVINNVYINQFTTGKDIADMEKPYFFIFSIKESGRSEMVNIDVGGYLTSEVAKLSDQKERDSFFDNFSKRINAALKSDYNGKFTLHLCMVKEGEVLIPCLYKIEGLPTVEQLEKEKKEKELAEKILKDKSAEKIAKGYIYHGVDEIERSNRLFISESLAEGHAYYISGFTMNKYAPSNSAYIWRSIFLNPSVPVIVEYKNQLVKSEVVDSSYLLGDYLPIDVVVAGGRIPVVLAVIK